MSKTKLLMAAALMATGVLVGCSSGPGDAERASSQADALAALPLPDTITVTSPSFVDGGELPVRFSCDGTNINPALTWDGLPAEAESLAIVVDDPDAPDGTYVHWVLYDIAVPSTGVAEDAVPEGAEQARNSNGESAYRGSCPPEGDEAHSYRYRVYALSGEMPGGLGDPPELEETLDAIAEVAVARGETRATFAR